MEAIDLQRQGWSIAKISERLGRDRKTLRSYLSGKRTPGIRISSRDGFALFLPYCRQRLAQDPHLAASVLFAEVADLGYQGGYSTFTRALRTHHARPVCAECQGGGDPAGARPSPPGREGAVRFDRLRLPDPPVEWGYGDRACLLLGSLTAAGPCVADTTATGPDAGPAAAPGLDPDRWCAVLAEDEELPHLVEAVDLILRRLGGTGGCWRFERLAPVWSHRTGRMPPALRQVARHYGVRIEYGPPARHRTPARRSLDEALRAWWRAVAEGATAQVAQDGLDRLAARLDGPEAGPGEEWEPDGGPRRPAAPALGPLPATAYPAGVRARRIVSAQGLVPYRGNFYAVPDHLAGAQLEVRRRLDQAHLSIAVPAGAVIARYRLVPPGTGPQVVQRSGVVAVPERRPAGPRIGGPLCPRSTAGPPSQQARAEAEALRSRLGAVPAPRQESEGAPHRLPPQRDRRAEAEG